MYDLYRRKTLEGLQWGKERIPKYVLYGTVRVLLCDQERINVDERSYIQLYQTVIFHDCFWSEIHDSEARIFGLLFSIF